MKMYQIEIKEDSSRVVDIKAENYEDAINQAEEMWSNGEIVLDYEDMNDVSYEPYPPQKIKDNFSINISYDKKLNNIVISSGVTVRGFRCNDKEDLINIISGFVNDNIEFEPVKFEKVKDKHKDLER